MSLMAGGIESTLKIGCTIIEMLIIDKVGRRNTLLIGSFVMAIAMVVSFKATRTPIINNLMLTKISDQRSVAISLPGQ